jgi:type I restriction enzyme M protein
MTLYLDFKETENSKIFNNEDFGYWKVTVLRPQLDEHGKIVKDKKGKAVPDKGKTDTEQIPLNYEGGIEAFMKAEVLPYAPDAWVDESKTLIGYEISFTKYFYKPIQLREIKDIVADIRKLEKETEGLLDEILSDI